MPRPLSSSPLSISAQEPLGLHVRLTPLGPSLRFALWLETLPVPDAFQWSRSTHLEYHPACFSTSRSPPFLGEDESVQSTHVDSEDWFVFYFSVLLPRIGNGVPMPLPALVKPWVDKGFSVRSRTQGIAEFKVQGWLIPPSLSIGWLHHLLHFWRKRYGDGAIGPEAKVVQAFLEDLKARLAEGPLLPTASPGFDNASSKILDYTFRTKTFANFQPENLWGKPGLVPPISLDELLRMRSELDSSPWLAQNLSLIDRGARSVLQDACVDRFAIFLTEILSTAALANTSQEACQELERRQLHLDAQREGSEVALLHSNYRSCLFPAHPVMKPLSVPQDHLSGVVDSTGPGQLRLTLGLKKPSGEFFPLHEVAKNAGKSLVERNEKVWTLPGQVAFRDLSELMAQKPALFLRPELFKEGSFLISQGEYEALAATFTGKPTGVGRLRRWAKSLGIDEGNAFRRGLPLFALKFHSQAMHLRIQWDPVEVGERTSVGAQALQHYRFRPTLLVRMGDEDVEIEEAERWLVDQPGAFIHAGAQLTNQGQSLIARNDLLSIVEIAHARFKVLEKLMNSGTVSWAHAVDLDDKWAAEENVLTESIFGAAWERFLTGLANGEGLSRFPLPDGFEGTLRSYQHRGLWWLGFLASNGFGACLADDMGLGKTIQVLALLQHRKEKSRKDQENTDEKADGHWWPALVICPTSVVSNWVREAARFTPGLRVYEHQGSGRISEPESFRVQLAKSDLVVTSFALARLDNQLFSESGVQWDGLIVDEAHNLKNPTAQQTRAIKNIPSSYRVGLTGTPVENHLGDIWSIFDFLNPGLLGGSSRFARAFLGPIREGKPDALPRLRHRLAPFLLRRTKDDPAIGLELPEKQEQEIECTLVREQRALYNAMVEATLQGLVGKDGMQRKAHVLAALMHLKQICNHPECFKFEARKRLRERSGKLSRCIELLSESLEEGHAALVFTQFRNMGELLVESLEDALGVDVLYFHGELTAAQRDAVVSAFSQPDGPPVLVLSLKAGGSGLNLTRASTVIHYDRWWNPAVERQATDRAHRMGQTQRVNVYKMITRGTIEERISEMMQRKQNLAEQILASASDAWVTELDDEQLRSFLSLGNDFVDETREVGEELLCPQ